MGLQERVGVRGHSAALVAVNYANPTPVSRRGGKYFPNDFYLGGKAVWPCGLKAGSFPTTSPRPDHDALANAPAMMWIVRLALRRPYTFTVCAIMIVLLGIVTIFRM